MTTEKTDDDIWGGAAAQPESGSAFDNPVPVIDSDPLDPLGGDMARDTATDVLAGVQTTGDGKSKPNMVILAGAGIVLIAFLGAVGFFGYKKYLKRTTPVDMSQAVPAVPSPVVAATAAASAPASATVVFAGTNMPGMAAPISSGTDIFSVTGAAPVTAPAVSAAASSAPKTIPSAPVVVVAPGSEASSACVCDQKALNVTRASPKNYKVKPIVTEPSQVTSQVNQRPRTSARPVALKDKPKAAKTVTAAVQVQAEAVLLSRQMRVVGVFPLTGKNAQAWVQDAMGRMQIVRRDEFIDGIRVLEVIPEQSLVRTAGGNIAASGLMTAVEVAR